jgi:trans-2,3-dihydro-3-hydroxyanthranilate isomerase
MERPTFYILDVFAEGKYTGNQLAVVRGAGGLSDEDMQAIAKEMNYSETTFILSDETRGGGYDVRIFTPKEEVPFAGHPTLGTAYVIQKEIIKEPVEPVTLNLKIGRIPVTFDSDILWMAQNPPEFGPTIEAGEVSEVLGLDAGEIDGRYPVREVSTGLPFIIVSLKNLDAVRKAKIDREKYFELIANTQAKALLVFCSETYREENHLNVRVFADYYGVPEDPATGSAAGCLAGYLVKTGYLGTDTIDLRVEQGYEIGRPSLLYLRAEQKEGKVDVRVGGKVVMVAEGKLVG